MINQPRLRLLATLVVISLPGLSFANELDIQRLAAQYTYYTEDYAPGNFTLRSKVVGVSVDTLKLIWQKLGVREQRIIVVSWARGYRIVQGTENTVIFSMARTQEREEKFKWVGPIYASTHILIAKSSLAIKAQTLPELFRHRTASLRNDIAENTLRELGFPSLNLVQVSDLKQAYFMLRSGRVDMMAMTQYGLTNILKQYQESADKYQVVLPIIRVENYFAFNLTTPDALISAFQQALDELVEERKTIKRAYGLPLEDY